MASGVKSRHMSAGSPQVGQGENQGPPCHRGCQAASARDELITICSLVTFPFVFRLSAS